MVLELVSTKENPFAGVLAVVNPLHLSEADGLLVSPQCWVTHQFATIVALNLTCMQIGYKKCTFYETHLSSCRESFLGSLATCRAVRRARLSSCRRWHARTSRGSKAFDLVRCGGREMRTKAALQALQQLLHLLGREATRYSEGQIFSTLQGHLHVEGGHIWKRLKLLGIIRRLWNINGTS